VTGTGRWTRRFASLGLIDLEELAEHDAAVLAEIEDEHAAESHAAGDDTVETETSPVATRRDRLGGTSQQEKP